MTNVFNMLKNLKLGTTFKNFKISKLKTEIFFGAKCVISLNISPIKLKIRVWWLKCSICSKIKKSQNIESVQTYNHLYMYMMCFQRFWTFINIILFLLARRAHYCFFFSLSRVAHTYNIINYARSALNFIIYWVTRAVAPT